MSRTWQDRQPPHHIGAVLETLPPQPLGEPSAAAKAFMPEQPAMKYEGFVEPTEALRKSSALFHATWDEKQSKKAIEAEQANIRG